MITKRVPTTTTLTYPIHLKYPLSQILFFDIETTGLSSRNASVYLIGAICHTGRQWELFQWLAENPNEESLILQAFLNFAAPYQYLFHFNGDTFDIPFLRSRSGRYRLPYQLNSMASIDLYQLIRPFKKKFGLTRMNQTTLETFLSIPREDTYNGGQLIPLYYEYVKTSSDSLQKIILLHNHDDLLGLLKLLSLLSYCDFMDGRFQVSEVFTEPYSDKSNQHEHVPQLTIRLELENPVPKDLSFSLPNARIQIFKQNGIITVFGVRGGFKHFFSNYRDYYYLPLEDTAIHKSVASYVDRQHRLQAKASTCYCTREGTFFPQVKKNFQPSFKKEYQDTISYFELSPNIINNTEGIRQYVLDILHQSPLNNFL